jgi:hypothetical protein
MSHPARWAQTAGIRAAASAEHARTAIRTQRHPDPDLIGAAANVIGDDAVDSDRDQNEP